MTHTLIEIIQSNGRQMQAQEWLLTLSGVYIII
jgi:hypothetical protein